MIRIQDKLAWALVGALCLLVIGLLAGVVSAGPLDPPGPPTTGTMKTLDDIPGSWDRMLSATGGCTSERFTCVLSGGNAVLDKETGLVWEKAPSISSLEWYQAVDVCVTKLVAGRRGWRLPTVQELYSLKDSTQSPTKLPAGHPFVGISGMHWSATSGSPYVFGPLGTMSHSLTGYAVDFSGSGDGLFNRVNTSLMQAWCVRGPDTWSVQ